MTVENPLEDRVRRIALELIEVEEGVRADENQHLLERDYSEHSFLTEEAAKDIYEDMTHIEVDEDELVNGILELFYSYRGLSEAQDESLLAASTYAVMHHLLRYRNITLDDVAERWDVGTRTISEHTLDMLEARFLDFNQGVYDTVEMIVHEFRPSEDDDESGTGLTSLSDFSDEE